MEDASPKVYNQCMAEDSENLRNKAFSVMLLFIIGFVGFSVIGAVALILLVVLGLLPVI